MSSIAKLKFSWAFKTKRNIVVSATKVSQNRGWPKLVEHYEKEELVTGRNTARCKGGAIVEHIDTNLIISCRAHR